MLESRRNVLLPLLLVVSLALLAGAMRFAWAGLAARHWADDYCYSAVMAGAGFLRGPWEWYLTSGNRFSTILVTGLQDLLSPQAIRFMPALELTALLAGWIALLRQLQRRLRLPLSPALCASFALTQVFFLVLLIPGRVEAFYWRMGALHYFFPLSLLLFSLTLFLRVHATRPQRMTAAAGSLLLALFAGGFSETYGALQTALWLLVLGGFLLVPSWRKAAWRILAPLVGSLIALGLMLLSPSNAWRQAALPPPENLGLFLTSLLRYMLDFLHSTIRGAPVPVLAMLLLSGALGILLFGRHVLSNRQAALGLLVSLAAGLALAASAMAPSVYAGLQFPAERALSPVRFALFGGLNAGAVFAAWLLRAWLARLPRPRQALPYTDLVLLLALIAGFSYTARHLASPLPEQERMQIWAERWDDRDQAIRGQLNQGIRDILTRETEVVQGIADYGPDPASWINRCAAAWYGADTLTARP